MRLKMKTKQNGSEDGVRVQVFEAGRVYDIHPSLAVVFLREGWAEEEKPPPVEKALEEAPANKAMPTAPENKGRRR